MDFSESSLPYDTDINTFLQSVLNTLYPNNVIIFDNGLQLGYTTYDPKNVVKSITDNKTSLNIAMNAYSGGATDAGLIFDVNLSSLIGKNKKLYITGYSDYSYRGINIGCASSYSSDSSIDLKQSLTNTSSASFTFNLDDIITELKPYLYIGTRSDSKTLSAYIQRLYIK